MKSLIFFPFHKKLLIFYYMQCTVFRLGEITVNKTHGSCPHGAFGASELKTKIGILSVNKEYVDFLKVEECYFK